MRLDRIAILIGMSEAGIRYQGELAKKAGVSRITVVKGMNGGSIAADSAMKIAAALNTSVYKIMAPDEVKTEV